jgi:hypothetical protein
VSIRFEEAALACVSSRVGAGGVQQGCTRACCCALLRAPPTGDAGALARRPEYWEAVGIPGLPRWGMKSAAAVLSHYRHLDAIPDDAARWVVPVRGAAALAQSLAAGREQAQLYRTLVVLCRTVPLAESIDALRWNGATAELAPLLHELGAERLLERVPSPISGT